MSGRREDAIWVAIVAIGISLVTVFFPIAFGVMPSRFFEYSCSASQALGSQFGCYGFLWNTVTTGVFIGIIGPIIGTFLVHREMALIGETLAHTAFAGVAFGTLIMGASGWDFRLLLVAIVVAVLGALAVQGLADRTGSYGDVPIAIMLTGSFAVGTLFIDIGGGFAFVDINSYLFGNISITDDRSVGLMAVLTLVVVGAMQILGVILVAAMLVVPVAAASLLAASFRQALYTSVVIGVTAVLSGISVSWTYELRPGATIVVIAIAIYLVAVYRSSG